LIFFEDSRATVNACAEKALENVANHRCEASGRAHKIHHDAASVEYDAK